MPVPASGRRLDRAPRRAPRSLARAAGLAPVLAAALAATVAIACRGPAEWRYEGELAGTPAGAAHAVHDARLAEVMRGLDSLRRERLPQALDPEAAAARQAREVARVARAMAESARRIAAVAPERLDADERAVLADLAARLARLCDELAADAPALDADAQRERLAAIDATCRGCHERLRIPWPGARPD